MVVQSNRANDHAKSSSWSGCGGGGERSSCTGCGGGLSVTTEHQLANCQPALSVLSYCQCCRTASAVVLPVLSCCQCCHNSATDRDPVRVPPCASNRYTRRWPHCIHTSPTHRLY